ncbi:MAG: TonB-dependent receptor [Bacteroidia bacterium]|nr:TonB-dependent receptor [Bacteroidia bacterium]
MRFFRLKEIRKLLTFVFVHLRNSLQGFSRALVSIKTYTPKYFSILLLVSISFQRATAQGVLRGKIVDNKTSKQTDTSLPGANVYWINGGSPTISDQKGEFKIQLPDSLPAYLIVSFTGYQADTIQIINAEFQTIHLTSSIELKSVEITGKRDAIGVSTIKTINAEQITQKELLKAACCNLSEAFETSPTVNVAYKDAVTGAKEIQLLGLSGIYSQLLTENIASLRGISSIYGLTFIPGPWMESIQVTKGSGSVIHGYESTTGQLNIEFLKPQSDETPKFYLNLFGEANGNAEINTHYKKKINDHWSSILMVHGNYLGNDLDHNEDKFKDMPTGSQLNLYNRWQYDSGKKLESQFGIKYLIDHRKGGQTNDATPTGPDGQRYLTSVENQRAEGFAKLGLVFPERPGKSIGNIVDFAVHDMKSSFGLKTYNANQRSMFLQSIYQNYVVTTNHQYKLGLTYRYDQMDQTYNTQPTELIERVPGIFLEYTYNYLSKLTAVFGLREDYHSNYGWIFTPRFHGKYNFTESFIFRMSAGRSYRVPYVFADNINVMASSKVLNITEEIVPERAWNYGVNSTIKFLLFQRESSLSGDLYRTDFMDQLIVDMYSDSTSILFYNLKGSSFSNSFQLTFNVELLPRLDVRLAYKFDDVQSTYLGGLEEKPFVSRNKALTNLSYETTNAHWKFNYTVVWEGQKKLPTTWQHSDHTSTGNYSPDFVVMNLQVTKVFRKFEVYGGAENLLDYTQHDPIINPENPFSNEFDATRIWGPIDGRRIFAGLRYKIR